LYRLLIALIITASGPEKFQITMQAFSITLSPGPVQLGKEHELLVAGW